MSFNIGDSVVTKFDATKIGTIIEVLPPSGNIRKYKVQIGASIVRYYEEQLEQYSKPKLASLTDINDFIALYVNHKLTTSTDDTLFSLNSGKIEFNPFQYRPLAKIVKAVRPRLLIADEVGVGKTIEAGLIYEEFKKRSSIDTCIIVCPKDLTYKWKAEMLNKFGERFEILTSDSLDYCIKEAQLDAWPKPSCIIGLELLRREENYEKLNKLEDLHFDMLIVDEAHHIINSGSLSHKVVELLCENSEITVFLSATPIQLRSNDLFSLLNLLNPEEFIDINSFQKMVEPNAHLNAAIRILRSIDANDKNNRALKELRFIPSTNEWARNNYANNPILNYWETRLVEDQDEMGTAELVNCVNDLESLQSFSFIVNRTKRKDIKEFTIRDPETVLTVYKPSEKEFFDTVMEFKRQVLESKYDDRTVRLIMSTIERQITSCIPAFVRILDSFINRSIISLTDISDDIDLECNDLDISFFKKTAIKLKNLASNLPAEDAKTQSLIEIVDNTLETTKDGKLLVFSFFRHTLAYLEQQLNDKTDARISVITGTTSVLEREETRRRFRLPKEDVEAIDVLLCSEVGCEGLDYEFCSRLVNYDIPWNPMKIEQRIGRIDRFGQKAPKVKIFNFITKDTVEEKIYFRCYDRLGIFNSALGDLEAVLGDITRTLTEAAFNTRLTEDDEKRLYAQMDYIKENSIKADSEFDSDLFILDIDKKDGSFINERKVLQSMLLMYIKSGFRMYFPKTKLKESSEVLFLNIGIREKQELAKRIDIIARSNPLIRTSKDYTDFKKFTESIDDSVALVFDNSLLEAYPNAVLITVNHPLIEIIQSLSKESSNEAVCCSLSSISDSIPKGIYQYGCYDWHEFGYHKTVAIKSVMINMETGKELFVTNAQFEDLIRKSTILEINESFDINPVEDALYKEYQQASQKLQKVNLEIVQRKLSTITEHFKRKIFNEESLARDATDNKIKRLREGSANKYRMKLQQQIEEIELQNKCGIESNLFMYGFMRVE